ncbi:ATP synthase subunit b [mine drainage metagenome]|uniref:ATP synthase subunit b n=1 Tax=mine drainage metagenome TaxID=410659 RepID=A0A1J5STH0_9ZZZZ
MLIDWFTVVAQVVNFLILVWLLKRFLYRPILDAIDAREKKIAQELSDADLKKTEARKERDEFQRKNEEFDRQRAALMNKVTLEAQTERQRLLDNARKAADTLSAKRHDALISDAHNLNQALAQRTRQEVFAIARKALADLAATSLEERMVGVFIRRLHELDEQSKKNLGEAFRSASAPALLRSAFDLPETQRAAIQNALNETFSANPSAEPRTGIAIHFETAPELISGIELTANGQKVAWSISDYLAALGKSIDELLRERDKATADAQAKAESNLATKIGKRAYELYEAQGRKDGQAVQNWDAAEREIRNGIPGSSKVEVKPEAKPDTEAKSKSGSDAVTEPAVEAEPKLATKAGPDDASKST